MRTNRRNGLMIASLAIALLATTAQVPPAQAGPISDMIARRRQAKAMKLPPVTKPHTITPYKDPNAKTASLSQRFKKRFNLKRNANQDQGVVKASR